MTLMVLAMEPSAQGGRFTASAAWLVHEGVQSDIFDHLLAILPEFGLRLFQEPTGHAIGDGLRAGLALSARDWRPSTAIQMPVLTCAWGRVQRRASCMPGRSTQR
jgi:miniconductance mechanosensitive channel